MYIVCYSNEICFDGTMYVCDIVTLFRFSHLTYLIFRSHQELDVPKPFLYTFSNDNDHDHCAEH